MVVDNHADDLRKITLRHATEAREASTPEEGQRAFDAARALLILQEEEIGTFGELVQAIAGNPNKF